MAGKYTDAEREARGQYQKDGSWYTSSGYRIRTGGTVRDEDAKEGSASSALSGTLKSLREQKKEIERQTADAARQAYLKRMLAEKALPQQLSAAGMTGGLEDRTRTKLQTEYDRQQKELLRQRDEAAKTIDEQIKAEKRALREMKSSTGEEMINASFYSADDVLNLEKELLLDDEENRGARSVLEVKKKEKPNYSGNANKKKGSENRQPSGARQRNIGHVDAEEHSRISKKSTGKPKTNGYVKKSSADGVGAAVVGGIAAGYLFYRGMRLLPSLLPVAWWTIPANLMVP